MTKVFKKKCAGCHQDVRPNNEECVKFRILTLERYERRETLNYRTGYAVLRNREKLTKKMTIYLHRKCLAEHIWLVGKYANQTRGFSHIEVEVKINGEKIKYPMLFGSNGWAFGMTIKKNKVLEDSLKRLHIFIKEQDMAFVIFEHNGIGSPVVLSSIFDPMISSVTSTFNYKNTRDNAINDHDEDLRQHKDVGGGEEILVNANMTLALKTLVKIPI